MNIVLPFFIVIFIFGISAFVLYALRYIVQLSREDPTIWERSIRKFEKQDLKNPPLQGSILFTGNSSIVYWKTLKEDLAPLLVINRGFGGSRIPDVVYYVDRIVLPYKPRGVVFCAGENDITGLLFSPKKFATEVCSSFQTFCEKIHISQPDVSIYFISIKPPKRRQKYWPEMQKANELIKQFCSSNEKLYYIDIVPSMFDQNKNLLPDIFKWDGIHLNQNGYLIWSSVIKPILLDTLSSDH